MYGYMTFGSIKKKHPLMDAFLDLKPFIYFSCFSFYVHKKDGVIYSMTLS